MEVSPVRFEAYEADYLTFTVEAFDECCATVEIKTVVNLDNWDEISSEIKKCLEAMNLQK